MSIGTHSAPRQFLRHYKMCHSCPCKALYKDVATKYARGLTGREGAPQKGSSEFMAVKADYLAFGELLQKKLDEQKVVYPDVPHILMYPMSYCTPCTDMPQSSEIILAG